MPAACCTLIRLMYHHGYLHSNFYASARPIDGARSDIFLVCLSACGAKCSCVCACMQCPCGSICQLACQRFIVLLNFHLKRLLIVLVIISCLTVEWYRDSVDNSFENSSVFSLICLHWLPLSGACRQ